MVTGSGVGVDQFGCPRWRRFRSAVFLSLLLHTLPFAPAASRTSPRQLKEVRTCVLYESPHRIADTLRGLLAVAIESAQGGMTSRPVGGESTVGGDRGNKGTEAATEAIGARGGSTVADVSAGRRWSGDAFVCVYRSGKTRCYCLGVANDAVLQRSCHEPLRHNTKAIKGRVVKKNDISSRWGRKCGHAYHQVGGAR